MLHEFLTKNRAEIIARTKAKVFDRPAPGVTEAELESGIPLFLSQLIETLRTRQTAGARDMGVGAAKHGGALMRNGFTVAQVVHDYGGLCQAITDVSVDTGTTISSEDFRTLNGTLDDAIASAVTEYGRGREQSVTDEGVEQLGFLAHELRNALNTATLAFGVLQKGTVGTNGSTSEVLFRSLGRMRDIVDRSLADVRLRAGSHRRYEVSVAAVIEEVAIAAMAEATHRNLRFTAGPVADDVTIKVDWHILVSALSNLVQNAFKFTRPNGEISLLTHVTDSRVQIAIEDTCGGLPPGKVDDLFRAFEQRSADRSGLGLGLAISRQAVEENGGTIHVRDVPGKGCVFTVDLPRQR